MDPSKELIPRSDGNWKYAGGLMKARKTDKTVWNSSETSASDSWKTSKKFRNGIEEKALFAGLVKHSSLNLNIFSSGWRRQSGYTC